MKVFVSFLLIVFFYSCMDVYYLGDRSFPIIANRQDSLVFSSKCGNVNFVPLQYNTMESSNKITVYLKHYFETDKYMLNTDSFKIGNKDDSFQIDNIKFMHRSVSQYSRKTKEIQQKTYQINANELIFVSFDVYPTKSWIKNLMILPYGYITCDDKSLIIDTVRIDLK